MRLRAAAKALARRAVAASSPGTGLTTTTDTTPSMRTTRHFSSSIGALMIQHSCAVTEMPGPALIAVYTTSESRTLNKCLALAEVIIMPDGRQDLGFATGDPL
jgi:hypothetical protein